jgi:hypothetical protein
MGKYTYKDIAEVTGLSENTIKMYAKQQKFDSYHFSSVIEFISKHQNTEESALPDSEDPIHENKGKLLKARPIIKKESVTVELPKIEVSISKKKELCQFCNVEVVRLDKRYTQCPKCKKVS